MHRFIYIALTVVGIAATAAAAVYAFADRGYFAVGGEYVFLFLPMLGLCVECSVKDRRAESTRRRGARNNMEGRY